MNTAKMAPPKGSITDRLTSLVTELPEKQQAALLRELESKLAKERRRHTRKAFVTVVDFASQGRGYREFAQNISGSGVYIQTKGSFSVGQDISLTFPFPKAAKHLKINGRIVRADDNGIGIQFDEVSPAEEIPLRSLLNTL